PDMRKARRLKSTRLLSTLTRAQATSRRAASVSALNSERQDVALAAVAHGADIGAQTHADPGADRSQDDAVRALIIHAQTGDQIGRALDARVAAIEHVRVVEAVDQGED